MRQLFLFILFFVLISGCRKDSSKFFIESHYDDSYYVLVKNTTYKDSAVFYARKIEKEYPGEKIFVGTDSSGLDVSYKVKLGKFSSSYLAGQKAYKLFGLNSNYSILKKNTIVSNDYQSIIYIADNSGTPSVYVYNLANKKTRLIWSHKSDRVIKVDLFSEKGAAFFLTAGKVGRKGIFPFIKNLKLYLYNETDKIVKLQYDIGHCIQVFTLRETAEIFKIVFFVFDKNISTYVIERSIAYHYNGAVLSDQSKTYDLVKENYPLPPEKPVNLISPNRKFILADTLVGNENQIYIKGVNSYNFLASLPHYIEQIAWTGDSKYLVITTSAIKRLYEKYKPVKIPPSAIFIYDLVKRKTVMKFLGNGYKNFYLRGDLLFFNSGFKNKAGIKIYDIKTNKMMNSIVHKGGCSLFYLPAGT